MGVKPQITPNQYKLDAFVRPLSLLVPILKCPPEVVVVLLCCNVLQNSYVAVMQIALSHSESGKNNARHTSGLYLSYNDPTLNSSRVTGWL